jgi:hypothetical protein
MSAWSGSRHVLDFARGRPTNPARMPVGANADLYHITRHLD